MRERPGPFGPPLTPAGVCDHASAGATGAVAPVKIFHSGRMSEPPDRRLRRGAASASDRCQRLYSIEWDPHPWTVEFRFVDPHYRLQAGSAGRPPPL